MLFKNNGTPSAKIIYPKVKFTLEAFSKMYTAINAEHILDDLEIGWMGTVERDGNDFKVTDIFVPEQDVHATTTEITPEGLDKLINDLLDEDRLDCINNMKLWGHSHVNMGVTPSYQDKTTAQELSTKDGFFIRLIANKKNMIKIDLWDYDKGIEYENLDMEVMMNVIQNEEVQNQIANNVSRKVSTVTYTKGKGKNFKSKREEDYNKWWIEEYGAYDPYYDYGDYLENEYKSLTEQNLAESYNILLALEDFDEIQLAFVNDFSSLLKPLTVLEQRIPSLDFINKYKLYKKLLTSIGSKISVKNYTNKELAEALPYQITDDIDNLSVLELTELIREYYDNELYFTEAKIIIDNLK